LQGSVAGELPQERSVVGVGVAVTQLLLLVLLVLELHLLHLLLLLKLREIGLGLQGSSGPWPTPCKARQGHGAADRQWLSRVPRVALVPRELASPGTGHFLTPGDWVQVLGKRYRMVVDDGEGRFVHVGGGSKVGARWEQGGSKGINM
jgi:hypothetical protein